MRNRRCGLGLAVMTAALTAGCGLFAMSAKYSASGFEFVYPDSMRVDYEGADPETTLPAFERVVVLAAKGGSPHGIAVFYANWRSSGGCGQSETSVMAKVSAMKHAYFNAQPGSSEEQVSAGQARTTIYRAPTSSSVAVISTVCADVIRPGKVVSVVALSDDGQIPAALEEARRRIVRSLSF